MVFTYNESSPVPENDNNKLGIIVVNKKIWNLLFLKSVEQRRQYLFTLAETQAKRKYGDSIKLTNISYKGN